MDLLDALSLKVCTDVNRSIIFNGLTDLYFPQVYPRDPPQIAAKRLILENVLLLANRRIPTNDYFDLDNPDVRDSPFSMRFSDDK